VWRIWFRGVSEPFIRKGKFFGFLESEAHKNQEGAKNLLGRSKCKKRTVIHNVNKTRGSSLGPFFDFLENEVRASYFVYIASISFYVRRIRSDQWGTVPFLLPNAKSEQDLLVSSSAVQLIVNRDRSRLIAVSWRWFEDAIHVENILALCC